MTKAKNPKIKLSLGDAFARVLKDDEQKQRDFEALYTNVIGLVSKSRYYWSGHEGAWRINDAAMRRLKSAADKAAKWVRK